MANGSIDEKVARADRIREQSEKSARVAELNRRATGNAIAELRGVDITQPYRAEMDSEITVNTKGLHARGVPGWALGATLVALAIAAAIVAVLRFLPR